MSAGRGLCPCALSSLHQRNTDQLLTFYFTLFFCNMWHVASQNGGFSLKSLLFIDQTGVGAQVTVAFFILKPQFINDLFKFSPLCCSNWAFCREKEKRSHPSSHRILWCFLGSNLLDLDLCLLSTYWVSSGQFIPMVVSTWELKSTSSCVVRSPMGTCLWARALACFSALSVPPPWARPSRL